MKAIHLLGALTLATAMLGCSTQSASKTRDVYFGASNSGLSSYDLEEKLPDESYVKHGNIKSNTDIIDNQSAINTGFATNAVLTSGNVSREVAYRTLSDTILSAGISDSTSELTNQIAMVNARVTAEVGARQSAQTLLSNSITTETNERTAADTTLSNNLLAEQEARIAGDAGTDTKITNAVNTAYLKHDWVVADWVNSTGASIEYTEHPVNVALSDGATWSCADGWPETKAVFMKVTPAGDYTPASNMSILGYGTWPTSTFQCVIWYMGGTYYVNVLSSL